jgi:hypothetical protein
MRTMKKCVWGALVALALTVSAAVAASGAGWYVVAAFGGAKMAGPYLHADYCDRVAAEMPNVSPRCVYRW